MKEFSAGGIVFNSKGQVLLVQHSTHKHWGFPKGHIEKEKTKEEAALREVKEEGGIDAKIIDKVGITSYFYTSKTGDKIYKEVTIFLMEYISGDVKDHDWEVSEAVWLDPNDAMERLTFDKDKVLLKEALKKYQHD